MELDKAQSELRKVSAKETALVVKQQCLQEELRVANNEVALFKVIPSYHFFPLTDHCFS